MAASRADARHEAAHAMVAVRLGLPLLVTDVTRRRLRGENGDVLVSAGFTELDDIAMKSLIATDGETALRARAVFAAAGIVPEHLRGAPPTDVSHADDLNGVREYAARLGVTDLPSFLADCINEATELLLADNGVTWDRLTTELLRKRVLTGTQVRNVVEQVNLLVSGKHTRSN